MVLEGSNVSERNSRSGDAPIEGESQPDVPPYDAPTEVFGAVRGEADGTDHASENEADGTNSEQELDASDADADASDVSDADGALVTDEADAAVSDAGEPEAVDPEAAEPDVAESESESEAEDVVASANDVETSPPVAHSDQMPVADESPTIAQPIVPAQPETPAHSPDGTGFVPPWRKIAIGAGAVVAVLTLLYAADWLASSDRVPRGVTVAGIDVGGKSHSDAEALLRSELGQRVEQPVQVDVGDRMVEGVPAAAGLDVDWNATLDRAGSQPINPITRLTSLFGSREIGVVSTTDEQALTAAVDRLRDETDREAVEGDVVFEGSTPVAIAPLDGRVLDADQTRRNLQTECDSGATEVAYASTPVSVTQDAVDRAMAEVAVPATSAPVIVEGRENVDAILPPDRVDVLPTLDDDRC